MNYLLPYDFVLRYLYPIRPTIRKLYGCYALYLNRKMMLFLRHKELQPEFNGVFVATQPMYFEALENELHISHMVFDLGGEHSWIFISEDLEDFEKIVMKACELIKASDERIGH